jgi:hypothetical protein
MGNRLVTKVISTRIAFINTTLNPIDKTQFSTLNNALYCVYLIVAFTNVRVYHESRGCSTKTEGRCILGRGLCIPLSTSYKSQTLHTDKENPLNRI